jgi:hypothetical protein
MKTQTAKTINSIAIILIIITFGVLWAIVPYYIDDCWYMDGVYGIPSRLQQFAKVYDNVFFHWLHDTGRLVNLISPFFLTLMPKWVFAIIASLALWVIIRYACKLVDARPASLQQWLMIGAITFVLPWNDNMFSVIYSLNYVFTAALYLFVLYRIMQLVNPGFVASRRYLTVTFIATFLCGWAHEGFSVPLAVGLVVYALTIGLKKVPRRFIWLGVALCAGIVFMLCGPAIIERLYDTDNIIDFTADDERYDWIWRIIGYNLLYYTYVIAFALSLRRCHIRAVLLSDGRRQLAFHLMLLSAGAVLLFLFFKFYTGARCGFCVQLISSIGLVRLFNLWQNQKHFAGKPAYAAALAVAVTASTLYVNSSAVALQVKLNRELEEVKALYLASEDGIIYYDVTPFHRGLPIVRTSIRQLTNDWNMYCFSLYYGSLDRRLQIFPTSERPAEQ